MATTRPVSYTHLDVYKRQVDYGKNRNQALTAVIFVTGLSGIKVNFGNVQLTGMVLACVVGMILSLIFYLFDKMKLTNDQ